jgi:cation diffusion facilitator CzcD-associated flavoprotein CzcO
MYMRVAARDWRRSDPTPAEPTIAIIGAGAAGLCMAMRLKQAGRNQFTIFEKSDRVGGTWRDNRYPGAACDVPSHLYSFSFAPKHDWSRVFAQQPEIQRYFEDCAAKYDLGPHLRFNVEIASAEFDDVHHVWRLRTKAGEEIVASIVVCSMGQLNRPQTPELPGLKEFAGDTFHSARWRHELDLSGREVAVIGSAASAVQIVPRLAEQAKKLYVFQRSANWILPRKDREYGPLEQQAFAHLPGYARLYRNLCFWKCEARFLAFGKGTWLAKQLQKRARRHLKNQIADPRLRQLLTPDYPAGCKRVLISDDYYPSLLRPNVELVTEPIQSVTRDGLITADGSERGAEAIVFATGFETSHFLAPVDFVGRAGVRLREEWRDGAEAYLGLSVAGFPNLFPLYGPNTNLGHNSVLFMIECQVNYVLQCIAHMRRKNLACLEVNPGVHARFNDELQTKLQAVTWSTGCTSWYKTASGKVTNNWSGFATEYWWRTRRPDWRAFLATPLAANPAAHETRRTTRRDRSRRPESAQSTTGL